MFAGRTAELAALESALDASGPGLILMTGRPKVGKTRLIHEATKHRSVIYLHALKETARLNFHAFKQSCVAHFGFDARLEAQNEWLGLLSSVALMAKNTPGLVIVLDNFSVLCEGDETLPFTLRTFWKSGLVDPSAIKLVLCGSNVARMTDLTQGSPALAQHALADCQPQFFDIGPLPLCDVEAFFPTYSPEARIAAYAIFGGVPAYLSRFDPDKPVAANIYDLLLRPEGALIDAPSQLLNAELRDIKVYASIVRAIAIGYRESGDIRAFVMGPHTGISISPYLEKLRTLRLIQDVRPLGADPKARFTRFVILDPLTRFWNLFIQPHRLAIEQGRGREVFDTTIKRQLNDYMLMGFEDICRDYVQSHAQGLFGMPAETVGRTWGPGYNIPIAGTLKDGSPVFGACEWHTRPVGDAGAELLMRQMRMTHLSQDNALPYYVLFSRSGFTPEVQARARQSSHLKLVTIADITGVGTRHGTAVTERLT